MRQTTLEIKTRTKTARYTIYIPPGVNTRLEHLRDHLGQKSTQETITYLVTWAMEQRQDRSALSNMQAAMQRMVEEFAGLCAPVPSPKRKGKSPVNE